MLRTAPLYLKVGLVLLIAGCGEFGGRTLTQTDTPEPVAVRSAEVQRSVQPIRSTQSYVTPTPSATTSESAVDVSSIPSGKATSQTTPQPRSTADDTSGPCANVVVRIRGEDEDTEIICKHPLAARPKATPQEMKLARALALSRNMSLAGSIADLSAEWIPPSSIHDHTRQDRDEVPRVSHIVLSRSDSNGEVTIEGGAGAIPEFLGDTTKQWLRLIAVDQGSETCVQFRPDGSFSARLSAGPGATIMLAANTKSSCRGPWVEGAAGALIRVPEEVDYTATSKPFSISGAGWSASGELADSRPHIWIEAGDPIDSGCIVPRLHIYRLFDAQGEYAGQVNLNVHGPAMTPTGLPIETDRGPLGYWALVEPTTPDTGPSARCVNSSRRYDLKDWTSGLEPGWYRPRIAFYEVGTDGTEDLVSEPFGKGETRGIESNTGVGFLPLVKIGDAGQPRIPSTLLNEAVSWGSGGIRGVVANEDLGRFVLGSRRAAPGPFIASPRDPLSGRSVNYLLEPYLPTLGYTGFAKVAPQIPLIPLDESAPGTISVSVTRPDGTKDLLANNAPILQSFFSGSELNSYPVELSFAGPSRTYGVTTGLDELNVRFEEYGLHTVSLDGRLRTLWGQELKIVGTYDIWVSEPLDLSLGTLEGTPLEVGDQWSPVVVIDPGVPAQVDITIDHYVNGDPAKRQSFMTSGVANRFGYFVADQLWEPEAHGEYIIKVTAKYVDPVDGGLWMGTRSGASIVATPQTSLIAHGERNRMLADVRGDETLRTWFFTRAFDPECGEVACGILGEPAVSVGSYPFFRGDISWLADMSPIAPSITLEDPNGILEAIAPQVARDFSWCTNTYCADAKDMKRLSILTNLGSGGHHRPEAVDSWAYWYTSTVRPDVSIHHAVSEISSEHNRWYGFDSYNCQIGLTCFGAWTNSLLGDRNGDEEGDFKLQFGGAVIKGRGQQHFVPYASMSVIVPGAVSLGDGNFDLLDPKGNRICPPYQGAAGGLANCGPLLTIDGREFDLFVTPTGTRPGSVLEIGDTFVFSGQASPTLDVGTMVTVTAPSGRIRSFSGRANSIGYIDSKDKMFTVDESGVYTVHVSLTQDRSVPSTGLAPDQAIIADGRTVLAGYHYSAPLSAILGSADSTYHFFVAEPADILVDTYIDLSIPEGGWARVPNSITVVFTLPEGAEARHYTATVPGLSISDEELSEGPSGEVRVELVQDELYDRGYTSVVLGADSIQVTLVWVVNGHWFAKALNLRGPSPLGGAPPVIFGMSPPGTGRAIGTVALLVGANYYGGND